MIEWILVMAIVSLVFAFYSYRFVSLQPEGEQKIVEIGNAIREGAKGFLKRQYTTIGIYFGAIFVLFLLLANLGYLSPFVPFAFLTGGFFSGLCGYLGMTIATKANVRTTNAAKSSMNRALRIAFSSGAVMGFAVVGFGLLDIAIWFTVLDYYYSNIVVVELTEKIGHITSTILTFGMGASSVALFARVGGGIYTKGADVGADLVGKVEKGIPEDDPRNPAVIADQVGDNVGDIAGLGADLYESYVGAIIASMALAVAAGLAMNGVIIPLALAGIGIVSSIAGTFLLNVREEASQGALLTALRKGVFGSALLIAILSYFIVNWILGPAHIGLFYAILVGLVAGLLMGLSTEFFTSQRYKPTKSISEASKTGPATVIIQGLYVGMLSTLAPAILIVSATVLSYVFAGGLANPEVGLYGIGIAAVGLLSTLGITLASDAYGPVADNSGGISELSNQKAGVRKRTDALDALGNTTAATGKGFAISSAGFAALALIAAYKEHVELLGFTMTLNLMNPALIAGLLTGGMLPFLFSSLILRAVGRAAQMIIFEVRRQFNEIKGLAEGKAKPKYGECVTIVTKTAQKEMVLPSLTAIFVPVLMGFLLGADAVIGVLVGTLVSGFMLAIFMGNVGGAWDNAKKFIEAGNLGGKGSYEHKAAVVGDTVGDPLKDASGPSINILIKLMSMVSIVFAAFVLSNSISIL